MQGVPLSWHWGPQVPLLQLFEQQSENFTQDPPLGLHIGGPQFPCALHGPEQHGSEVLHAFPSERHICGPHTPLKQMFEQHGEVGSHSLPSGMHIGGPHTPPLHWLEQH
jgi:hypothetical protein